MYKNTHLAFYHHAFGVTGHIHSVIGKHWRFLVLLGARGRGSD